MSFIDVEILPETEYWYRLVLERSDGGLAIGPPLQVRNSQYIQSLLFPPVFSQGRVMIRYRIAEPGTPVALGAFNVRGQLLHVLDSGVRDRGDYVRFWDGRTGPGVGVPRGVYLIRLQAGAALMSRKVVVTHE